MVILVPNTQPCPHAEHRNNPLGILLFWQISVAIQTSQYMIVTVTTKFVKARGESEVINGGI